MPLVNEDGFPIMEVYEDGKLIFTGHEFISTKYLVKRHPWVLRMLSEFIRILKHELRKEIKRERTLWKINNAIERTRKRIENDEGKTN